jgi:hypothetical protein
MAANILPANVRSVERLLSPELTQNEPMAVPCSAFPPLAPAGGFSVPCFFEE